MPLKQVYRTAKEKVYSLSMTDVLNGTGVIKFYCMDTETSAGADYNLSSSVFYSRTGTASGATSNPDTVKAFDQDFDTTILVPQTIGSANAILNIPVALASNSANNSHIYVIAQLKKYDGTTETNISTAVQSDTYDGPLTGGGVPEAVVLSFALPCSEVTLNKDDILRLNIQLWQTKDVAGSGTWYLGFDPTDRDLLGFAGTGATSVLSADIPFKIEK